MLKIVNYTKQYKQESYINYPDPFFCESIRDRSSLNNWNITPHIHTHLYQFFFLEIGSVEFEMTKSKVLLDAPAVIIIPPGIVHGLCFDPSINGHVLTLEDNYIEDLMDTAIKVLMGLDEIYYLNEFDNLTPFEFLTDIVRQIHTEMLSEQKEKAFALKSLIGLLLVRLYRLSGKTHLPTNMAGLPEKQFYAFQKSLKQASPFSKTVPEYASELHLSTVHLNRICRAVSSKSTSWLLQEHIITEAKKLLLLTDNSVSEIAYELNFSDPSYFSRLFKKFTNMSPGVFRKNQPDLFDFNKALFQPPHRGISKSNPKRSNALATEFVTSSSTDFGLR